jgi:hypothetical protein
MPLADEHGVEEPFRTRYLEMVRLAGLLGADDPEDIAQEAFTRLVRRHLDEPQAAPGNGYAHENVRRVVLRLGRKQYGGMTRPAGWSGRRTSWRCASQAALAGNRRASPVRRRRPRCRNRGPRSRR